jgi:hypothetical protein
MIYTLPQDVTSPRDFIENVDVIYDGGAASFAIARVDWDGMPRIAMRWNVAIREWDNQSKVSNATVAVGMPSSHGVPVWFIIPPDFLDQSSVAWAKVKAYLDKHPEVNQSLEIE